MRFLDDPKWATQSTVELISLYTCWKGLCLTIHANHLSLERDLIN
jgi:hypothetical protein